MASPPALLDACVRFASEVSAEVVDFVVAALERGDVEAISARLSGDTCRSLKALNDVRNSDAQNLPSLSVANLLAGAAHAVKVERANRRVEVVLSGPAAVNSTFRSTGPALLELVNGAKESIHLVTFAAYRVPFVAAAIQAARRRGVRVVLVMETEESSAGKVSFDGLPFLQDANETPLEVYVWPLGMRTRDARGRHGSLHAKFAVADKSKLLVSSANLTEYAFELNMELGVLLSGGVAPAQAANHIEGLIRLGVLQRQALG